MSTQLIILNYPTILSHRRCTTVYLETYLLDNTTVLQSFLQGIAPYIGLNFAVYETLKGTVSPILSLL